MKCKHCGQDMDNSPLVRGLTKLILDTRRTCIDRSNRIKHMNNAGGQPKNIRLIRSERTAE